MSASSGVGLKLAWGELNLRVLDDVDEEDHDTFQALGVHLVEHLLLLRARGGRGRREAHAVLMSGGVPVVCVNLVEEEGKGKSYHLRELLLVTIVHSVHKSTLPGLRDYHKELSESLEAVEPELHKLLSVRLS